MTFKEAYEHSVDFMLPDGSIAKISDYKRLKSFGFPAKGINVVDPFTSEIQGIILEKDLNEFLGI